MDSSRLDVGRWLVIAGVLLLLPPLVVRFVLGQNPDAAVELLAPVARVPLGGLTAPARVSFLFAVPSSDEWTRIRKRWGDPGYVIFAFTGQTGGHARILAFQTLDLDVVVTAMGATQSLEKARNAPYGYSSDTTDYGLAFRAKPGTDVRIELTRTSNEKLPDGELVVRPYWDNTFVDRSIVIGIDNLFRGFVGRSGPIGVVLILIGALVLSTLPRDS